MNRNVIIRRNFKKKLKIPAGVREIEFTEDGKYLFAVGFFDGMLYVIDTDENRILKKIFVGYESRGISRQEDGNMLVGSSCGVVEIDTGKLLKGIKPADR